MGVSTDYLGWSANGVPRVITPMAWWSGWNPRSSQPLPVVRCESESEFVCVCMCEAVHVLLCMYDHVCERERKRGRESACVREGVVFLFVYECKRSTICGFVCVCVCVHIRLPGCNSY